MEKTKLCKKCKEPINKGAKKCPKCGSNQGIPKFLIVIIVIVVIAAIASMGKEDTAEEGGTTKSTTQPKFSYTVDSQYNDTFSYYIEGTVKNNKDREYSYISIEFVCYDAEGNNLGTAIDSANSILANQTWKYKAIFLGSNHENIDHCDYHDITSW